MKSKIHKSYICTWQIKNKKIKHSEAHEMVDLCKGRWCLTHLLESFQHISKILQWSKEKQLTSFIQTSQSFSRMTDKKKRHGQLTEDLCSA